MNFKSHNSRGEKMFFFPNASRLNVRQDALVLQNGRQSAQAH